MNVALRLMTIALFVLLSGCANVERNRGQLTLDLRPEGARTEVVWPLPPDPPRYRYVGELVGEPNFVHDKAQHSAMELAVGWLAGLFERLQPELLNKPNHGVTSGDGRIYVVDSGRNAVLVFDPKPPAGGDSKSKEGQLLIWDKAAPSLRFVAPIAAAIVWNGDIAVSDAALGVIVRLDTKGEPIGMFGGGQIKRPTGLAYDRERGLLFVADTVDCDIKVFDQSGQLIRTFGGPGEEYGKLNAPTHLAYANGKLYVSDTLNSRIQMFDGDGRWLDSIGERGLYIGNLTRPKGVAVDAAGIVYVMESYFNHMIIYDEKGRFLLGINGSSLKEGRFLLPSGVWTDSQGRVYVADSVNGRVVIFQSIDARKTETGLRGTAPVPSAAANQTGRP